VRRQSQGLVNGPYAEVSHRGRASAEQSGGEIGDDLVHETGPKERRGNRGPTLEPDVVNLLFVQRLQCFCRVVGRQVESRCRIIAHPRSLRDRPQTHHHAERLTTGRRSVGLAHRQRRVVSDHGPGADEDRVAVCS